MTSAFGVYTSEIQGVKGISWAIRGKRGHCEGISAVVWGSFGCAASGEVQNQELQMEKFHVPILATSEARGSLCAVEGVPGGLGTPDHVKNIAQIYIHLSRRRIYAYLDSQTGGHIPEETMTVM